SLSAPPDAGAKSAGTPPVARASTVESAAKLIGTGSKRREEPRLRMTSSMEADGSAAGANGRSAIVGLDSVLAFPLVAPPGNRAIAADRHAATWEEDCSDE